MSKTSLPNSNSPSTANAAKSGAGAKVQEQTTKAKTSTPAAAVPSSSSKATNGTSSSPTASSNLSSQNPTPPVSNWAKIAAGANSRNNSTSNLTTSAANQSPAPSSAASSTTGSIPPAKLPLAQPNVKPNPPQGVAMNTSASQQGHAKKPSAVNAEPFASSKALPIKQPDANIAFGNVGDGASALSSSPAQPPAMDSVKNAPVFGSISHGNPTRPSSAASGPTSQQTPTAAPATAGAKAVPQTKAKIAPIDFNTFFQGGSNSPTSATPNVETAATSTTQVPPSQTLHTSNPTQTTPSPQLNSQTTPGTSSRRASTYDNTASHVALSPRSMNAQLPLQGTPAGGLPHPFTGGARPFSPAALVAGNKVGTAFNGPYNSGIPQSPSLIPGTAPPFTPGGGQSPYPASPYMKANGIPIAHPSGPVNISQQGQARNSPSAPPGQPFIPGRAPVAAQIHHQANRNIGASSPRVGGGPAGQPFYPGQQYGAQPQQQWYHGYGPYAQYPAAYGQQQFFPQGQQPGGQPIRPPMQPQQSSQMGLSTPSSPAPSMRPSLSTSGSPNWVPPTSSGAPGSDVSGPTSTVPPTSTTGLTSPSVSAASAPGNQFRPPHLPSTPTHGHQQSISQGLHPLTSPPPTFTPQHTQSYSMLGSPSTPGTLNAGATSFAFQPARPNAAIQIARAPSKALQIKKPPPKETKSATPSNPSTPAPTEKKDKEEVGQTQLPSGGQQSEQTKPEVSKDDQEANVAKEAEAAAATAAAAKQEEEDKLTAEREAKEKENLAAKAREQEEEARRIREAKEAEEKAVKERQEAEQREKDAESAAIAAAKAEEQQRIASEKIAAEKAAGEAAASEKPATEVADKVISAVPASLDVSRQASSTVSTEEESVLATPVGEAATSGPGKKAVPEPLDLSSTQKTISPDSIVAPGSSLSSARIIENLTVVPYPDNIKSPNPDLNASAKPGKFRYDREFLLQFMDICKGKPEQLPSLEALGMTDEGPGPTTSVSRTVSHGGRSRVPSVPPTPSSRMAAGMPPPNNRSVSGFAGAMGQFTVGGVPLTSAERFAQSTQAGQGRGQMARTPSGAGGPGGIPMGGASGRGMDRNSQRGTRRPNARNAQPAQLPPDVAPLELGENRWVPSVQTARTGAAQSEDSPDIVERKVKALLNKLTIDNFDSISKQILAWADKSAKETDGRILKQVIALIFEKATDEQTWSAVYARLCWFLAAKVSNEVADHSLTETTGTPTAGGKLFRRYLLTRCQQDYEKGWAQKESATAAAKGKAADDQAKKAAAEKEAEQAGVDKEVATKGVDFSDEYYAAEKAKRRGLGLVRFIGELFKLGMLREKIMHECIKKLIDNVDTPEEEDIESLCRLLRTVGKQLEEAKDPTNARYMGVYFTRLQHIVDNKTVSSRLQFMILDLMDTRKNGWIVKEALAGPKSIAEIHQDNARQREEEARRTASAGRGLPPMRGGMERGGSRRGQGRDGPVGPDGWQNAPAAPRPQKAGDLASLGKVRSTSGTPNLLPGFAGKSSKAPAKEETSGGAANPFALLAGGDDAGSSELSPPPSDAPQRTPLKLAPRTINTSANEAEAAPEESTEDGEIDESEINEATKRSIDNSVKEYLGVRDISEAKATFEALPERHRGALAKAFIIKVIDGKQVDVTAVINLFKAISEATLVPQSAFKDAFHSTVVDLEDLSMDAPRAFENAAQLMSAARLSTSDVQSLSEEMVSNEDDLIGIQKRLLEAFEAASS